MPRGDGTGPVGMGAEHQAEQTFPLGRGIGRQLMTEEEWQEHCRKIQWMGTEEWERYRTEHHKKMVERARERGIILPEEPRRMGPGAGGGMGRRRGAGGAGRRGGR